MAAVEQDILLAVTALRLLAVTLLTQVILYLYMQVAAAVAAGVLQAVVGTL